MTEIYCMICDTKLKHKDYKDDKVRVHPCKNAHCKSPEEIRAGCAILGEICVDCGKKDCTLNF